MKYAFAAMLMLALIPVAGRTQTMPSTKATVVLVHGAWADASSFDPRHQTVAEGRLYGLCTAERTAQPRTGCGGDLDLSQNDQSPVILVGHSYGGSVISVASVGNPNVKALVYIDAFVPDGGESPGSLLAPYPAPPKDFFVRFRSATAMRTSISRRNTTVPSSHPMCPRRRLRHWPQNSVR